jgi:Na+-translocating ferredoxin:NAD+ oxidoreductase RnfA subunit
MYPFHGLFTPLVTQRIAVLIRILLSIGRDFSYFSSIPGSKKKVI